MKTNLQDDQIQGWGNLLQATRESNAELRGVGPFVASLEESHGHAVSLRSRRDAHLASAMELTAQLKEELAAGRDAARALRSYIRAVLGPRSEKLLRFGIKALRGRGGRG